MRLPGLVERRKARRRIVGVAGLDPLLMRFRVNRVLREIA